MAKLQGAKIGDYHTLTDWGLYLKVGSPKISDAEVDEYLVKVPGSDTLLNLTDALDGRPHYKKAYHHHGAAVQGTKKRPGRIFTVRSQTPSMANGYSANSTMTRLSIGRGCGACL